MGASSSTGVLQLTDEEAETALGEAEVSTLRQGWNVICAKGKMRREEFAHLVVKRAMPFMPRQVTDGLCRVFDRSNDGFITFSDLICGLATLKTADSEGLALLAFYIYNTQSLLYINLPTTQSGFLAWAAENPASPHLSWLPYLCATLCSSTAKLEPPEVSQPPFGLVEEIYESLAARSPERVVSKNFLKTILGRYMDGGDIESAFDDLDQRKTGTLSVSDIAQAWDNRETLASTTPWGQAVASNENFTEICAVLGYRPPTRQGEKDLIKSLLHDGYSEPAEPGSVWYLIGRNWWELWNEMEPPGKVVTPDAKTFEARIDTVIPVNEITYKTLTAWYGKGSGDSVTRKVLENGVLEISRPAVHVTYVPMTGPVRKIVAYRSRTMPISVLKNDLCKILNISPKTVSLWYPDDSLVDEVGTDISCLEPSYEVTIDTTPWSPKTGPGNIRIGTEVEIHTPLPGGSRSDTVAVCTVTGVTTDRITVNSTQEGYIDQTYTVPKTWVLKEQRGRGCEGRLGLLNLGNTCYMNASLQCLSHTRLLREYFLNKGFLYDLRNKGKVALALSDIFQELWCGSPGKTPVNSEKLRRVLRTTSPQFTEGVQHDAHEFLESLLDGLGKDIDRTNREVPGKHKPHAALEDLSDADAENLVWKDHVKTTNSVLTHLFSGVFKSKMSCDTCAHTTRSFEPFSGIHVPLPASPTVKFSYILYTGDPASALQSVETEANRTAKINDLLTDIAYPVVVNPVGFFPMSLETPISSLRSAPYVFSTDVHRVKIVHRFIKEVYNGPFSGLSAIVFDRPFYTGFQTLDFEYAAEKVWGQCRHLVPDYPLDGEIPFTLHQVDETAERCKECRWEKNCFGCGVYGPGVWAATWNRKTILKYYRSKWAGRITPPSSRVETSFKTTLDDCLEGFFRPEKIIKTCENCVKHTDKDTLVAWKILFATHAVVRPVSVFTKKNDTSPATILKEVCKAQQSEDVEKFILVEITENGWAEATDPDPSKIYTVVVQADHKGSYLLVRSNAMGDCLVPSKDTKTTGGKIRHRLQNFVKGGFEISVDDSEEIALPATITIDHTDASPPGPWKFPDAKLLSTVTKSLQVARWPPLLMLQLKRFNHIGEKITTDVGIPKERLSIAGAQYNHYSVINHMGSCNAGHYYTYVNHDGCWWSLNDASCTRIGPEEVSTPNAYLLFFERSDCADKTIGEIFPRVTTSPRAHLANSTSDSLFWPPCQFM